MSVHLMEARKQGGVSALNVGYQRAGRHVVLVLVTILWLQQVRGVVALVSWQSSPTADGSSWQQPGCHLLGHSGAISIPGCTKFSVMTNGCRGYCPSVTLPALPAAPRPVTSLAHCCAIMESRPITVKVLCLEGERNVTLMSATACSCYHCHKD